MIRRTWLQMGMPITVCIVDETAGENDLATVVTVFEAINQRFSPYLETSEVCRFNRGTLCPRELSDEFSMILEMCERTTIETNGYFDAMRDGKLDPSGLVKGWAIEQASNALLDRGFEDFFVDAGGDVRAFGLNGDRRPWRVGIRNPFRRDEIVKVLAISNRGVATSGTAIRGEHIYNPHRSGSMSTDLVSLTVIGPTVYEADRMATAAFAMGDQGLAFIADQPGLDGYAITVDGLAAYTEGFASYVQ